MRKGSRKPSPVKPPIPRPANVAQSLRRIRAELSLMLAAVDDGLQRIEAEPQTQGGHDGR